MELDIYQVDAFTFERFKGNPAGVCITEKGLDERLMLAIAAEMAVSETAFLSLSDFSLRWFTPQVEVSLCGHGTLSVAHILQETGRLAVGDEMGFNTLSGTLSVIAQHNRIAMAFPSPSLDFSVHINEVLFVYLGIQPQQVVSYCGFDGKWLIEVIDESIVLALAPNFEQLKQLPGRGVVVTAKRTTAKNDAVIAHHSVDKGADFISRYFAPWVGVNEDPVTGSAHCALAVYWQKKLNKTCLKGYQASQRGGFVDMEVLANEQVTLMGQAVTTLKGKIIL
ncbi:PhzF family phenazine biosynthesis protein [uncultured Shewanella sp.]|uniref:PhzF family phenazine biosynthesis protein n=1 Tax=uncultured Shewanella sp. TaxID=173975 RepID=UPI00260EC54F|nr:PhzF family phenazine biosynthesis protein [uncultured Shewanella sp.]